MISDISPALSFAVVIIDISPSFIVSKPIKGVILEHLMSDEERIISLLVEEGGITSKKERRTKNCSNFSCLTFLWG